MTTKNINNIINQTIKEYVSKKQKNLLGEQWYHGTPDVRELEKMGGFTQKHLVVDYINDIDGLQKLNSEMQNARDNGDEKLYHRLLNNVDNFKETYKYNKPIFLTDKYSVAKSYANPQRAFDYQGAVEKIIEVEVDCNKLVKINAFGDRFRFIAINKVKQGFINAGVSEQEIDTLINRFNYYIPQNKGIQTDVIAAIGNWLGFDCIDVVGVLDSYDGGTIKSTVRMVLKPNNIKIKNK